MLSAVTHPVWKIDACQSQPGTVSPHPCIRTQAPNFRVVDPRQDVAGWNALIGEFPTATVFHTSAWANVLSNAYGYRPCYFVSGPAAAPRAIVPLLEVCSAMTGRRGISLPFTDCCAPLIAARPAGAPLQIDGAPDDQTTANAGDCALFNSQISDLLAVGRSRHWRYLELRGATHQCSGVCASNQFVTHRVDLTVGEKALWKNCSSSVHRAVRKAKEAGLTVRLGASPEDVRGFYHLQCRTRRKHGLPPQPLVFFELLQRHLLEGGFGRMYIAESAGQIIAGAIFLHFGKHVVFKYGASHEDHLHLRANNLLMWQGIADYAKAGFKEINFGRTELHHSGLRRYKLSFGTQEQSLDYHRFDYAMDTFVRSKEGRLVRLSEPVFRYMPLSLARIVGVLLYRHAA